MSDQKKDSSADILREISDAHEDQPGDLGKTITEKTEQTPDQAEPPPR